MSSDTAKKRKVAAKEYDCGSDHTAVAGVEDIIAEMKARMTRMQNEMNSMRERLSNVDKLESKTSSMQNEIDDMKRENNFLKTKCSSLEISVSILVKEQTWEYSAPGIPIGYWAEGGFDEDYIEEMESFLDDIKRATIALRKDGINNNLIFLGNPESATALLHDDALLPHWNELANAMQLYQGKKPFTLSINHLQLSATVIDLLLPMLKHKPIGPINLQNNSFVNVREGIEFAEEVMKSNERMDIFSWKSNAINSMEDARYLVDAIVRHPSIDKVHIMNCFGGDINGYGLLRPLLAGDKNFSAINLDRNHIRTGGDTAIPDYLATNPPLTHLCLANNNLNDEDARLIARALKRNTNLQYIFLVGNNITEVGCNALSKAVYNPESLNSLADCNHTCIICGIDFGNIPENFPQSTPLDNRSGKIHHLLSVRNKKEGSNAYHFNLELGGEEDDDELLGLVPHVLESVNRYAKRRPPPKYHKAYYVSSPLSIMYEILQSWKMPELYELSGNN